MLTQILWYMYHNFVQHAQNLDYIGYRLDWMSIDIIFLRVQCYTTQNDGMQPQLVLAPGIMSMMYAFRNDLSAGTITQTA